MMNEWMYFEMESPTKKKKFLLHPNITLMEVISGCVAGIVNNIMRHILTPLSFLVSIGCFPAIMSLLFLY